MSTPYLSLLEALRVSCSLPEFPDPLPSTQMDLELENGPTITIDFNEETEFVEIFSSIGTYEAEKELEILKRVAEANFLWNKTGGGTLSVRPEVKTVYLGYQIPVLSLNGTDFIHLVEKFVETVTQWQKLLIGEINDVILPNEEKENSDSPNGSPEPPPPNSTLMMA